jgi:hypothetical protein
MANRHQAEVPASPQAELHQFGGLAKAIATAAMEAAADGEDALYRVDEILIQVKPNPGPTSYKATIVKV